MTETFNIDRLRTVGSVGVLPHFLLHGGELVFEFGLGFSIEGAVNQTTGVNDLSLLVDVVAGDGFTQAVFILFDHAAHVAQVEHVRLCRIVHGHGY